MGGEWAELIRTLKGPRRGASGPKEGPGRGDLGGLSAISGKT